MKNIKNIISNAKENINEFFEEIGFETKSQKIKRMEDEINRLTNENLKLQGKSYKVTNVF